MPPPSRGERTLMYAPIIPVPSRRLASLMVYSPWPAVARAVLCPLIACWGFSVQPLMSVS